MRIMNPNTFPFDTATDLNTLASQIVNGHWENLKLPLTSGQRKKLDGINSHSGVKCLLRHWLNSQKGLNEGIYCNANWDTHYCWPPTPPDTIIRRNCSEIFQERHPEYASKLIGHAFRVCQKNGSWLRNNWTNYTECVDSYDNYVDTTIDEAELKEKVRYIVFVGSIISIIFLVSAIVVFLCFRSIWCDRVIIHVHLKLALTLRYILLMIITEPFIFNRASNYRDEDWVCKAVLLLYLYSTLVSVNWMFIQGIYLNGKLTTNIFDKKAPVFKYCLFGWSTPIPLLAVYTFVMERIHPVKCWKGYAEMEEIWIILTPILVALLINFCLLINILRILLTKGHKPKNNSDAVQLQYFKRAAKATIVLAPLLGINNLLFIYNPGGAYNKVYVVLNTFFGSTQGIFVAIVYCYLSTEVYNAFRRKYRRFLASRSANTRRAEQQRRANFSSLNSCIVVEQPIYHLRNSPDQIFALTVSTNCSNVHLPQNTISFNVNNSQLPISSISSEDPHPESESSLQHHTQNEFSSTAEKYSWPSSCKLTTDKRKNDAFVAITEIL